MGYDHSLSTAATLKEGITLDQLVEAFKPILDYFGYDRSVFEGCTDALYCNHKFHWVPETGEFSAYICGEVSCGYKDLVEATADKLGSLVKSPNEFLLYDHDTGDIDNAKNVIPYAESPEAVKRHVADTAIAEALELMRKHLSMPVMEQIEQLAKANLDSPKMAEYMGYLATPGGETIQLDFMAPVGASQSEKDACFMNAFAQVGNIEYLEVGVDDSTMDSSNDGGFSADNAACQTEEKCDAARQQQ